jgi:hypothetical protein
MRTFRLLIKAIASCFLVKPGLVRPLASQGTDPAIGRRRALHQAAGRSLAFVVASGAAVATSAIDPTSAGFAPAAHAAEDCYADCFKNCKAIAPKDTEYCEFTCNEYCSQPDRKDGLSGSVSYEGGEVGILGGTFGTGTVVKGQDKPPSVALPGLDFTSPQGKKLLGY